MDLDDYEKFSVSNHRDKVGTKHHLLPRFYLQRFAGSNGMILKRDGTSRKVFSTAPENALVEKDFYTFTDSDLEPNGSLEKLLSHIESEASMVFRYLDSIFIKFPLPSEYRDSLSAFAAMQAIRGRKMRRTIEILGNEFAHIQLKSISDSKKIAHLEGVLKRKPTEDELNSFSELVGTYSKATFIPQSNHHIKVIVDEFGKMRSIFARRPVSLLKVETAGLITSDEPLLLVSSSKERMQPIGFANAELIQLPISPKRMLIFGPIDSQFPERILSEDQLNFKVSGFNKMMVNNSHEWVFANPDYKNPNFDFVKKVRPVVDILGTSIEGILSDKSSMSNLERKPRSRWSKSKQSLDE